MTKHTDERDRLDTIVQETRAMIILNILGHPEGSPSLAEIDHHNPGKSKSTLRCHLDILIAEGVVARVELPEDERTRDNPHVFYALTEEGWRTLNRHAVFLDDLDDIRYTHAITEKTDRVQRFEEAPRPDLSRQGQCYVHSDN